MSDIQYDIITSEGRPDFTEQTSILTSAAWPEFMLHDPVSALFTDLYEKLGKYQFALVEKTTGEWIAMGNSIPLAFDGNPADLPDTGWDWALQKGVHDHDTGRKPTILCAIQVVTSPAFKSKGMSIEAVRVMKSIGVEHGLKEMIAPVRPSLKSQYPLTPIDDYINWNNTDGLPFDPWMRVHARLGAKVIKPCPLAMRISGTIAEWESWTEMRFPQSGKYIIPGALRPVDFDIEADRGVYVEPNVWMHHQPNE